MHCTRLVRPAIKTNDSRLWKRMWNEMVLHRRCAHKLQSSSEMLAAAVHVLCCLPCGQRCCLAQRICAHCTSQTKSWRASQEKKREPTSLVHIIYSSLMYYVGQSKGACNSQGRSPSRSKVAYFLLTVRLSSLSSAGRARFSVLIRIAIVCITTGNRVRIFVCVCVFQATTMHFIGIYYIVKYTNI